MSKALELEGPLSYAIATPVAGVCMIEKPDAQAILAELRRLAAVEAELERIRAAVNNLHKVKGRFHTEQAYRALVQTCGLTPKDPT